MSKIIVIAGTPGTGKSTIGGLLAEICGLKVLNLSTIALERGFVAYYDEARQTYVIDEERLAGYIAELAEKYGDITVLTHYPEILPKHLVRAVFVLRTHPLELEKRLLARGWSRKKINENVMAEILGVVAHNAVESFGENKVFELDTTSMSPEECAKLLCRAIRGEGVLSPGVSIDWLSRLSLSDISRFKDYEGGGD